MAVSLKSTGVQFPDGTNQIKKAYGVGTNQSWVNMTASRVAATTYTNTTERPIMISVITTAGNTTIDARLIVDGLQISKYVNNPNSSGIRHTITGLVPVGSTYSVTLVNTSVEKWMELR